jgi:phosphopantetheine--protein transferase-like protein
MTSSTSRSDPPAPILGCGVDCEAVARFAPMLAADDHPMPLVFTGAEVDHARRAPCPARALCACFCAKEALFKALGGPYEFTDCELFLRAGDAAELRLAPALVSEHGIASATVEVSDVKEKDGVVMAIVRLYAEAVPL